jgi:hypothetical protein
MLGAGVLKHAMNFLFDYGPRVIVVFIRSHEYRIRLVVMRQCAVFIPCLFIGCQPALGANEGGECFYSFGLACKCGGEKSARVGPVVIGAVPSCFVEEGKRGFKSAPQLCASRKEGCSALSPQLEAMIGERNKERTTKGDERSKNSGIDDWLLTLIALQPLILSVWLTWPREKTPNVKVRGSRSA